MVPLLELRAFVVTPPEAGPRVEPRGDSAEALGPQSLFDGSGYVLG